MNFLLAITPEQYGDKIIESAGFLETLGFGAMIVLIGMATVFAVLLLLLGALTLFKVVFEDINKREKVVQKPEKKVVAEPTPAVQTDEDEIIAVIAAAIAMAESENQGAKFRVVSFRRK